MATPSKYTSEQEAEIAQLFSNGATYAELKDKFGGSGKGLRSVLRRQGVHEDRRGSRPRAYSATEAEEMASLFTQGSSIRDLVRKFGGCTKSVVAELKRQDSYEYRPGSHGANKGSCLRPFSEDQVSEIVRLWKEGTSKSKIAALMDTRGSVIERILLDNGLFAIHRPNHPRGEAHGQWKGGKHANDQGYVLVHVNCRYVPEHRHVMELMLGRKLHRGETVHHIDGDKSHNDPSNLQVRKGQHGTGIMMVCQDCGSHDVLPCELTE